MGNFAGENGLKIESAGNRDLHLGSLDRGPGWPCFGLALKTVVLTSPFSAKQFGPANPVSPLPIVY